MATLIKICGMTRKEDALAAAALGVDLLGFVFYEGSERRITPAAAREITRALPRTVRPVGVFVDADPAVVRAVVSEAGIAVLQFHGGETPEYCAAFARDYPVIKAFRVSAEADLRTVNDYPGQYCLFDTYVKGKPGGTGASFDWKVLKDFEILKPMILSGGLTPENVGKALEELAPFGVDVSSGVESAPGIKDAGRMQRFVAKVRAFD